MSLYDHTVDRHFLTRIHHDSRTHLDVIRIDLLYLPVLFYIGVIRTDIHEIGNILPALSDGVALEELTNLVEPHNGNTLSVLAESHGSDGRNSHKEILVEHLSVHDSLERFSKNIISDCKVGNHE